MVGPLASKSTLFALAACLFFTNLILFLNKTTPSPRAARKLTDINGGGFQIAVPTQEESDESQYGKVVHGTDIVVLYNAVPKTGSRTFEYMVREYRARTSRDYIRPKSFPQNVTSDIQMMKNFLSNLENGSFVRGHFPYTRVKRSNTRVVYINSVREPVQRIISNYYFDMFGDRDPGDSNLTYHKGQDNLQFHEKTIDECISKRAECFNYVYKFYKRQTFYILCGNHPSCRRYDRNSLEIAKKNVDGYLFIGDAKEFDNMLAVLQRLLPDYFSEFLPVVNSIKRRVSKRFHTSKKIPPTNTTLAFLKEDLHLEIELYEYITRRFKRLQTLLGI